MATLTLVQRVALTAYVLPFFVGGIVVASALYQQLDQSVDLPPWLWPLMLLFVIIGVLLSGLVAYFLLIFVLVWRVPTSPLLVEVEVASPRITQRALFPLFHAVGKLARYFAPKLK